MKIVRLAIQEAVLETPSTDLYERFDNICNGWSGKTLMIDNSLVCIKSTEELDEIRDPLKDFVGLTFLAKLDENSPLYLEMRAVKPRLGIDDVASIGYDLESETYAVHIKTHSEFDVERGIPAPNARIKSDFIDVDGERLWLSEGLERNPVTGRWMGASEIIAQVFKKDNEEETHRTLDSIFEIGLKIAWKEANDALREQLVTPPED